MPKHFIAKEGPLKGLTFILEDKDEYLIGRDPDIADFVVEDSTVSRKHAKITKTPDGYCIEDLSNTNPILVNDLNIAEPHLLKEGDSIVIGKTPFSYSEKELSEDFVLPKEISSQNEFETIFADENFGDENIVQPEIFEEKEPKQEEFVPEEKKEEKEETVIEEEKEPEEAEENFEAIQKEEKKEELPENLFEEEAEEAPSYNIIPEDALILKVLSGPNAGAEFRLEKDKSYIIGKDPDSCDIVFNDLSVSKDHGKISIDKDGNAFIEDLGSKNGVIVNSKKIKGLQKVSSKDLILIGTTTFLILDPKEALETIYSPQPLIEEEKKMEEKEAVAPKFKEIWRKQIIPFKHLVVAGSIVIVLFTMFLCFFSLFKSKKIEIVQKNPVEEIKAAISKFDNVEFSFNPANGKLFLVGHVLTAIDEQELMYNVNTLDSVLSIENNIIIDEYVWKNTNDLLNNNALWRNVAVHSAKAGKFIVSGYLASPDEAQKLMGYLNANFPYVDKLESRVVVENVLKLQIEGLIITKGFSAITYQLNNGELVIAGRYSMDNSSEFESLLDNLKKLDGVRTLKNVAIKTTPDMARINLSQTYTVSGYITSDKKGVSIIVNNKIVNMGGSLDGMKITDINPDSIYLEKEGLKYKIDYKR
jgi:type III secretion system YscD/HrpQ family protein